MSVGRNLQEMENVVTKGAQAAEPMSRVAPVTPGQSASWEDLGGPTPENYTNDPEGPAKLKDPGATLAQVRDVVNAKAAAAATVKESSDDDEELFEEADEEEEDDDEEEDDEEEGESKAKPKKKKVAESRRSKKSKEEDDEEDDDEEDDDEEDDEEEDENGKKMKKEEFDIEEDVNALLAGEELSEEFQQKAKTIFEAAIRSKVVEIKEELQETYEQALIEEVETIKQGLIERVDAYLEYVADEWISENALAIEQGLKTEMTESFLQGMKGLFEDHYVSIPEDRYDVIESMVDKLDEMEEKLNEQIERNVALNRRLAESVADVIFADVAEGLALSQKDKLASLAENVEFDSEANYREKLVTLRESYFPSNSSAQRDYSENLSEEVSFTEETSVSPVMEAYLQTLGRVAKR
jgi:hypothetical protein